MSDPKVRLAIVLTPAGACMGSLLDTEDGFVLQRPRVLSTSPESNGMIRFQFSELIGKPAELVVAGDLVYWLVTDQTVTNTYLEAISSIKIAHTLPPRNTIN